MKGLLKSSRKIAIFDIDGTIFRSSFLIELVEVLIEKKVFHDSVRADYDREKVRWLDRKGDYEAYIDAVVKVFMRNIKGVSYEDFSLAAKLVVSRYRHRTYRFTEELITELKMKKYFVVAISHSPKGVLDLFCKELGFDKVYGKFYELGPNEKFTGKILGERLIMSKANILRRVTEVEGLTLKGSVGVGDTESDISFFELVNRPICFNPNMKLWKHAQKHGWEVIVERKDVVYELNKKRVS
ncbi:MAG: HAD-IB family phosphatase [Candidatus Yonathbacteria bacterium]|nr:HAD-IB family phosphatase [Candidatus Yonathbacteria bacterium]